MEKRSEEKGKERKNTRKKKYKTGSKPVTFQALRFVQQKNIKIIVDGYYIVKHVKIKIYKTIILPVVFMGVKPCLSR
jgi:hypothetical protein